MGRHHVRGLQAIGRSLAALVVALGLGATAAAEDAALEGMGVVRAKSALDQSVTIDAARYRVTEDTRLVGLNGGQIPFSAIPVTGADGEGTGTQVRFEARSAGGDLPELELLQVVPEPR